MDGKGKIVIYCSASYDIDQKYNQAAREVVRAACSLGYGIVSGGTVKGTMGVVADEVVRCGGTHTGVIPRFMAEYLYPALDKVVWTDTMAERKEAMREGTVAAIALPGGIGTLDELIGTLTLAKLGKYSGKVIAFDYDGFFEPLKALLEHYVSAGMMDTGTLELLHFPRTAEEVAALLK